MKSIFKLAFSALLLVAMTTQSSAQCAHNATNILLLPATQGAGVGFGQSFLADCINDEFTDITFSFKNFNNAVWTVELFDGQSDDPADLLYSQTGVVPTMGAANPNSTNGVFYTATLGGGTGSLAYTQGQIYTFICTLESGSHAVEFGAGDQYLLGAQYYSNTSFTSVDNYFEFGSGAASTGGGSGVCGLPAPDPFIGVQHEDILPGGGLIGGPTSLIGHSITMEAGCASGNAFTEISMFTKGNAQFGYKVEIYAGESVDAGDLRYTSPDLVNAPGNFGTLFTKDITGGTGDPSFVVGNTYTFLLRPNFGGAGFPGVISNPYSGGKAFYGEESVATFHASDDLYITIGTGTVAEPVPTMGEWALITFGLIIMSMGVITVRRREQNLIVKAA